jgi:prepilin-type N-terminal cleavage/methylation domain-containing protein
MGATPSPRIGHGFTLVEILVVVVVLGLIMAMSAVLLRSVSATQKRSITSTRLASIDAALVQFVMQQRRLPCPADGTLSASAGGDELRLPSGICTGNQAKGVVPWKTLGLSATDATDGWNRRITYRVDKDMSKDDALNLSWCDPAGTGGLAAGVCNATCTSNTLGTCTPPSAYLSNKGINVKNLAGVDVMLPTGTPPTGAAYVLVSHGESGGGAYLDTGLVATSTLVDGTEEQKNYPSLVLQGYYVDDQNGDVGGAAHFDDIVSRPSILAVAAKAGLGPRSH